jgi:GNAT superfamily N-acetyltransferase
LDGWWTLFRSGMWRLYYKLSAEGRTRFHTEFLPLMHDTLIDVLGPRAHDCYYLVYLGSRPSARGKGYARKLIEDISTKVSDDVVLKYKIR